MKTRTLLKNLRSVINDKSFEEEIRQIVSCQVDVILLRKAKATAKTRERKKRHRCKKSL